MAPRDQELDDQELRLTPMPLDTPDKGSRARSLRPPGLQVSKGSRRNGGARLDGLSPFPAEQAVAVLVNEQDSSPSPPKLDLEPSFSRRVTAAAEAGGYS